MAFFFTSRFVPADSPLSTVFEPIRAKYKLPALAGAIFTTDGVVEIDAVGVRKAGSDVPVTVDDLWHLGSDTKMMTATLAGTFVAEKKLSWDDKIISFFPDLAPIVAEPMRNITIGQVLSHQAGICPNLDWWKLSKSGTLPEQRLAAVRLALTPPTGKPGSYLYSNTDYVIIGAVLEKISGKSWEDLIREKLLWPLGMESVGFGGTGTMGRIDQPWPHTSTGAAAISPLLDNPAIVGPGGTVHCTMRDWARFLIDQLRGGTGEKAFLPNEIYQAVQTAHITTPGFGYGYGWQITDRPWAGGKALTHNGSNTVNYSVCWLAPAKKFGVLVCSNQGGDTVAKACDEAAYALIMRYTAKLKAAKP
jgi:CubicO group peptidase (beta-lactamase class C family)